MVDRRETGVKIEDVPKWLILEGIGHAIASSRYGWRHTLCRIWTPNGATVDIPPKRICRKCRAALKTLTLRK